MAEPPQQAPQLDSVEEVILHYHGHFQKWARILTGGDPARAEDLVQELCLNLCLAKPDLSAVERLDGYLYTALRHLHLSKSMRLAREQQRTVSVENFDVFESALSLSVRDPLKVQNDLIRVCNYVVWRRERLKSSSLFILHFFHGYHRKEVAALGRIPLAAVYNGVRDIRTELQSYLQPKRWPLFRRREEPPSPTRLHVEEPEGAFLQRIRHMVFQASAICPSDAEWSAMYQRGIGQPVPLKELAHLSGCSICLDVVKRVLHMNDHEGPLDDLSTGSAFMPRTSEASSAQRTLGIVERRLQSLQQHRPTVLEMAVNGGVVATQTIAGEHTRFSYKATKWIDAEFVELFDEQGTRLAYLPLERGMTADHKQRIRLSDQRSLLVRVSVQDASLHAEAEYEDPALPGKNADDRWWEGYSIRPYMWVAAAAASCAIGAFVARPYFVHPPVDVHEVMAQSIEAVSTPNRTEALHRTIQVQELDERGQATILGSVDVWRDEEHGELRILFGAHARELSRFSVAKDGRQIDTRLPDAELDRSEQALIGSNAWKSDVSARDFAANATVHAVHQNESYQLTAMDQPGSATSRTLRLDAQFKGMEERVSIHSNGGTHTYQLIQTSFSRVPVSRYPIGKELTWRDPQRIDRTQSFPYEGSDSQIMSANLEVQVLYDLFQLHLDIGQPLVVHSNRDGQVNVEGTIRDPEALKAFRSLIDANPLAGRVHLQLRADGESTIAPKSSKRRMMQTLTVEQNDPPGDVALRAWLIRQGKSDNELARAEASFAETAQEHAEILLQHASALKRLADVIGNGGGQALTPESRNRWAAMVADHTSAATAQLNALRQQMQPLALTTVHEDDGNDVHNIASFQHASANFLRKSQDLHATVIALFETGVLDRGQSKADSVDAFVRMLPDSQVNAMARFTVHMVPGGDPLEAGKKRAE